MRGATYIPCSNLRARQFLLTRLMRGATTMAKQTETFTNISTHAPHARRDRKTLVAVLVILISTHAPHARRDLRPISSCLGALDFYSRASCEARLYRAALRIFFEISTHAPHARRDGRHLPYWSMAAISTHAPHARRDSYVSLIWVLQYDFYSRASCEARHEHRKNCRDY